MEYTNNENVIKKKEKKEAIKKEPAIWHVNASSEDCFLILKQIRKEEHHNIFEAPKIQL